MKRTFIALTTAATLAASGAFADAHASSEMTMGEGLTMFETLVANELSSIGVEADVSVLTLAQLAQIKDIIEGDETTERKQENVMAIIN